MLLDIRLENRDWGGSELLDAHWQKIGAAGSKVILYSGKPDAIIAYEPFKSGRGPFLFLRRSGQQADEDELSSHIVRLLRDRVKSLCQRASLKSSIALTQAHSREEAPTGPMDALTHSAIGKPQYSEAARTAKQDLESLACGLNDRG
ncbi:TPA: hypothetical protein EYP66_22965 [Candidatus Poribacteria bacterium]|nr:hypothetical protein [Candidatus Poribacteria bacterium]